MGKGQQNTMNRTNKDGVVRMKEKIYWRILKHSPIFRYWYKKTCLEAFYDLERADLRGEQQDAMTKWKERATP